MTKEEVMKELEKKGSDSVRKIFRNHGNSGAMYGVKVADLKVIQKKVKKDHELAMRLFCNR